MERVGTGVGPKPANFDETQTNAERAVVITCCTVVALVMALRTLGRYALKLKMNNEINGAGHFLGLDDGKYFQVVFNFFAVLTFYGLAAAVLIVDRGMGVHIERVIWLYGTDGLDNYSFAIYFSAIFYNTTLGMVKLSVLALYRRILQVAPSRTLSIVNYALAGVVAANTIINVSIAAFQCSPVRGALITSCVRIGFLPALLKNPDATWAMGVPMDWSIVEPAVGILVSSMPAIRSILYLFRTTFGRSQNNFSKSTMVIAAETSNFIISTVLVIIIRRFQAGGR